MIDAPAILADIACARAARRAPALVGMAGAVAVGKSALAAALAGAAAARGTRVEVVPTDGFLYPNAVLSERGLLMRKGFPESYDVAALRAFTNAVRADVAGVEVPVYSHETYDIVAGERRVLEHADIVVIEGVNALSALGDTFDLAVYVDADESQLEAWFVERFHVLRAEAANDVGSFYRMFAGMSLEEADTVARQVWRDVNLANLREHIAPSRVHAHCVVVKGSGHAVTAIDMREHGDDAREEG